MYNIDLNIIGITGSRLQIKKKSHISSSLQGYNTAPQKARMVTGTTIHKKRLDLQSQK